MTFTPNLFSGTNSATDFSALRSSRPTQQRQYNLSFEAREQVTAFKREVGALRSLNLVSVNRLPDVVVFNDVALDFLTKAFGIEDLKSDRRLLLNALTEGPNVPRAEAIYQDDPRVREFVSVLNFDQDGGVPFNDPEFLQPIIDRWIAASFEETVAQSSDPLGKALRFDRVAAEAAAALDAEGVRSGRAIIDSMMRDADTLEVMRDIAGPIDGFDALPRAQQITQLDRALREATGLNTALLGGAVVRGRFVGAYLDVAAPRAAAAAAVEAGETLPSFTPTLPTTGYAGWRFLKESLDEQLNRFARSAPVRRDTDNFRANIAAADTAAALVADRQLLRVGLGAFGLIDELDKGAFVERALAGGTTADNAPANRISDPRYRQLSAAFGYGDPIGAQVGNKRFVEQTITDYRRRSLEVAVGEVDFDMRLALNFDREAERIAGLSGQDSTKWFSLLGDQPLRQMLEGALGLPQQFSQLDIDRQVGDLDRRFRQVFDAEVSDLADEDVREAVIRRYFALTSISAGAAAATPGSTALTLLQAGGLGSQNLFESRITPLG